MTLLNQTLQTTRLTLKPAIQADAPALFEIWASPEVARYMDIEPFKEIQQAKSMIAFFEQLIHLDSASRYSIFLDDKIIGSCGFNGFSTREGVAVVEIGYELAKRYWKKGYGTEIVQALVDYAHDYLPIQHIDAHVDKHNIASQHLLEKLGFELIAELPEDILLFEK